MFPETRQSQTGVFRRPGLAPPVRSVAPARPPVSALTDDVLPVRQVAAAHRAPFDEGCHRRRARRVSRQGDGWRREPPIGAGSRFLAGSEITSPPSGSRCERPMQGEVADSVPGLPPSPGVSEDRRSCRSPRAPSARAATTTPTEGEPMYATIRIYDEAAGLADAVAEHKDEIVGLFDEIDGFRGYYMVKTGPGSAT